MQPLDRKVYLPILWTKRGERTALSNSASAVKGGLRPVFVVPPIELDFDSGAPKKTIDEHLASLPKDLRDCWDRDWAFIDLSFVGDTATASGLHPLDWVSRQCAALGLTLVPVISNSSTAPYLAAARNAAARGAAGACLRLPIADWPSTAGTAPLNQLLTNAGVTASDAHLILDLAEDAGPTAAIAAAGELRTIPHLNDWLSLTIAGAGMPDLMPPGAGLHIIPRRDWSTYKTLMALANPLPRRPSFSDYAVAGISPGGDVNPRFMNISATLRYTAQDDWLIGKGGLFKGNGGRSLGGAAVPPAAQLVVTHPGFMGTQHCDLDDWLHLTSIGGPGGSPEVWRRQATLHHLKVVTDQVAKIP